ncbi:IS256 family transposase [Nocardia cyriacigeorgica]|uniref:IS256 family transposase n=1 Tax=Nocardia cyriacigeorgica TaxID=135487 RepID=UPI0018938F6B|nr:IS256 family transposase [Nocardia cyriacigeorgica]MBF6102098.1 IS256 family transposase [Nocardia cyriacigeorgica]MBF6320559.1 IS256 family transposase [Nocardia cyriacigeorgica]MBF6518586.1 IS256 family transposase [Nocardia cyriacigeorgica]MBF6535147.1 IS256 family transposase [Nocardia cyriacigeorgica]
MMTTLDAVAKKKAEASAEQLAAAELVRMAKEQGLSLTGPEGLLQQFTKTVLETALNEEMTEHLGFEPNQAPEDRESTNVRNGTRSKTVLTETTGPVPIEVPRDRDGSFEPQIVKKRQRRLTGVDEIVLSLYAKGLTTGEISAHFAEIYGASVSKETVSRITDKVVAEMQEWSSRPLDEVYVAIFIDAIVVKIRDGQVANRPIYAAIGVTVTGEKDILGLWAGSGGEGAKFWLSVLTEIRNRGVKDVFFLVCDGLKGLPEVVGNVWPLATVQTCIIHLIRNTFRLAGRQHWDALKRDVKPIYTAVNAEAARAALDELTERWGTKYGAIGRLWNNAWEEFIPFLDYDIEIRKVICSTNAIESLNARYRRAIKARGHFPTEQAALKCLYLVTRSLDPTGAGRARWTMRWKPAVNAFAITFADRWPDARTY